MNKVLEKEGKIILDDTYHLEDDSFKGLVLVFEEERVREKIDKETKKKNGETEKYLYTDKWYYPNLSMTLRKYLQLSQSSSKSIEELLEATLRVEKKVSELKSEHSL